MKTTSRMTERIRLFRQGIKLLVRTSAVYTAVILLLSGIAALLPPINAIILQRFLDSVVQMVESGRWLNSGLYLLLMTTIINVVIFVLNGILGLIKRVFSDKLDLYVTDRVLNKSIMLPMETFDNATIYNHINTAITQTSSNCLNLLEAISEIIYSSVKGLSFAYIILSFSWQIAFVSLLSVIPLLHLATKVNKHWYKIYKGRVEKKRLIEYLKLLMVKNENVKEIKLYNVGKRIIAFITNQYILFLKEDVIARKRFLHEKVLVQYLDNIVACGLKIWVLVIGMRRKCSLGAIMLYFNSLDDLKNSYNDLISQFASLQNSLQYLESLDVIECIKLPEEKEAEKYSTSFSEIEFKNVSFKYPGCDNYVLKNISLKFERGKTYFVVGLNGSGKTTLTKLLLRLYEPTEGVILIDGKDIAKINLSEYYAHTSAIFQDFIKYPFNVFDNVAVRSLMDANNRFQTVIEHVGMQEFVAALPKQEQTLLMRDWSGGVNLSQGQWQKLAIARCMYDDGIISILDEPFSSVDAEAETQIISNLRKSNNHKLMILISHRFSSINRTDQIIVLKNGMVVEKGTHEELMQNKNLYHKLFESQRVL